jgi:hypothetical protein
MLIELLTLLIFPKKLKLFEDLFKLFSITIETLYMSG